MRKFLSGFVPILMLFGTIGCEKENSETIDSPFTSEMLNRNSSSIPYSSIRNDDGILAFHDMESVVQTLDALESQYLNMETNYINSFPELSGEELTEMEIEFGYNENKPFEEFESYFSFSSLRKLILSRSLAFDKSNVENDPDDNFVREINIRTILNERYELKIGNSYYKFFSGGYIQIVDGDRSKLEDLERDITLALGMSNVIIEGELGDDRAAGCNSMQFDTYNAYNSSVTRRIKCQISHQTWPWNRYVLAETTNYKKKNSGWDKIRT
ncbi:MAG: hypothetical protein IPG07_01235 [Crocinitomicaceae bacterium]|nr:hypothetical protein [Crocinitomicaceae bacterium]